MKLSTRTLVMLSMTFCSVQGQSQCEADHIIAMADFYFAPAELTILPGETVAFVNVQGTHDVNGISNTLTGESWNNPAEFYLEQTEGTEEGTCMGVRGHSTFPGSTTSIPALAFRPSSAWWAPSPSTPSRSSIW